MNVFSGISTDFQIWVGALLTLMVFSFLYRDNPFYKFAEHVFVGVSAAYWMVIGFWTTLWPQLVVKLWPGAATVTNPGARPGAFEPMALVPLVLGLPDESLRLRPGIAHQPLALALTVGHVPRLAFLGKWATAFVLGTTAGYGLIRYLRSDFLYQVRATIGNGLLPSGTDGILWSEAFASLVILVGTVCGLSYFVQTRQQVGVHGKMARIGLLLMMITFGASFGSAVMGRVALLVGRFHDLLGPWLGIL